MSDLFISKIHIEKLRHLENVTIDLSSEEKKHLVITGKNGSGKTSLLNSIESFFANTCINQTPYSNDFSLINHGIDSEVIIYFGPYDIAVTNNKLINSNKYSKRLYDSTSSVLETFFADSLVAFMPADRKLKLSIPNSIKSITPDRNMRSDDFLNYILNLNYRRLDALAQNNHENAEKVQKWFDLFKENLREIYDSPKLDLIHNSQDLTFKISMPNREPFGFNEMADGYSSLLYIVMELMMKMESTASMTYDMQGIVFIDEIESHLHVELQRHVLRFLTKMFPRIQFIVTTHSPFVISSLRNAVVFDLERQIRVEDMSDYSYEGVIEHYYDLNQYSEEANKQFEIYKSLIDKANRTPDESEAFINARTYLRQIPAGAAQELVNEFKSMDAKRKELSANG
jgi:predicted ATP-binding protein involved in virulence